MTGFVGDRKSFHVAKFSCPVDRAQHIDRVDVIQALSDEATQLFGGGPPAFRRRREGKHALGHMRAPTSDGHLTRGDLLERGSERHAEAAAAVPVSATTAGLQAGAIASTTSPVAIGCGRRV